MILTVGDARVEAALDDVIAHGARAATMMSSLVLKDDSQPLLRERVSRKIAESGLLVCGANGMGFYNFKAGTWVCGFDTRDEPSARRQCHADQSFRLRHVGHRRL